MVELRRRLTHASGAGFPLLYLVDASFGPWIGLRGVRLALLLTAAVATVLEAARLTGRAPVWLDPVYDRLLRPYEREHVAGYALYLYGMAFAFLAFPPRVAVAAAFMLAIGDPISGALSSGGFAKETHVLLAMFGVCVLLAAPFVPPVAAILGAAAATIADGYKPVIRGVVVDDNLSIPIAGGGVMAAWLQFGIGSAWL